MEPEYSDAWTVGVVYQPSFVSGLATSFDYFDIRISDAISQIGIANIVNECFDRGAFCNQITRGVDDRIQVIRNIFINLDEFRTRGADIELAYRRPVNFFGGTENLSLRALGSRLFESSITPYQADKIERVGLGTFPNWNVTLSASYMRGPVSVSWTERWRSSVKQNLDWVDGIDIDRNRIPSQSVSNLRLTYNLDREGGSYSMYAAVQNLFDHNPGKVQGLSNIYGDVGRAYTVGIRFRN